MKRQYNNSISELEVRENISPKILSVYDAHSYRHAAVILKNSFPQELKEVEDALLNFKLTLEDIAKPGGNESVIPKKFSSALRPQGWHETRIQGDLIVRVFEQGEDILPARPLKQHIAAETSDMTISNYIDGHKIDYVKGRVALDLEWNSKDQTYDRDLYAFRIFHECGIISVAVLITRSERLNAVFDKVPLLNKDGTVDLDKNGNPKMCKQKYGASTTWMGKLLYRLNAGRHGGCPVMVFGIRPDVIIDWKDNQRSLI